LHLVLLDRWNELESPLHRLDPRSKILAVAALVLFLVLSSRGLAVKIPAVGALLAAMILLSRVPLPYCLKRACLVLPFSLMAVGVALLGKWLPGGEGWTGISVETAAGIVGKSYLSALAVLLLVATTRLSELLKALERLRVPGSFLMIVQFLYRYLFVLSEEAQHMSYARQSRSAGRLSGVGILARGLLQVAGRKRQARMPTPRGRLRAAATGLAVLFARSYARAERIHRAMLARGFTGVLPVRHALRWQARDFVFVGLTAVYLAGVHLATLHWP